MNQITEEQYLEKFMEIEDMVAHKKITPQKGLTLLGKYRKMLDTPQWVIEFDKLARRGLI